MNILQTHLASIFARNWWILLLRGFMAAGFGIFAFFQPGISIAALVLLFGAYTLSDGILAVWVAISGRKQHEHWWVLLLEGILGIGVAILTFVAPGITAFALLMYVAVWAIGTGLLRIVLAIRLRQEIKGEWWLVLGGLVSVVLGFVLMAHPAEGALSLLWFIASCAVVYGFTLILLAFKLRKLGKLVARK